MSEMNDEQGVIYYPIQPLEMSKETINVELHDLRNDIEYIKYVSTSTCIACNLHMIVTSLFCIFL